MHRGDIPLLRSGVGEKVTWSALVSLKLKIKNKKIRSIIYQVTVRSAIY